jgi:transposase
MGIRVSESCLARWLKIADREDGRPGPVPVGSSAEELRELKRRNKLLEQENEILRRATAYFARDVLPKGCTRWSLTSPPTPSPSR